MDLINNGILIAIALFTLLSGCGRNDVLRIVEQTTETVALAAAQVDEAALLIEQKNAYREATGQPALTPGLVCTLHNLQATQPSSIPVNPPTATATWVYKGDFAIPDSTYPNGLPILPAALQQSYPQWYLVRCTGYIVVLEQGHVLFKLTSDDGSMLYVNGGSAVVDNNGNHATQQRAGSKPLERGVYTFRLDYMQAGGSQSLIVEDASGVLSGSLFYR